MLATICAMAAVMCAAVAVPMRGRAAIPQELAKLSTLDRHERGAEQAASRELWHRLLAPLLQAVARRSQARWAGISNDDLRRAGIDPTRFSVEELVALKILGALVGATTVLALASLVSGLVVLLPAVSFTGFLAPSLVVRRRRAARQRQLLRELPDLVGLLKSFVTAGMTLEQALHLISAQQARTGTNLLAREIRHALSDYGLGLPIDEALRVMAERTGLEELELLAAALSQGKRQGSGMERILRDQEMVVRMQQRNRATAEASRVGTKLVGVLVAIYLPEFMILIMVPLFYGIFLRAFS